MTPEQIAATDALERAVQVHVQAFRAEHADNPEMTGDWMLVAAVSSFDGHSQEMRTAYHLAFSGGEMEEHRAYGLLRKAEKLLSDGC